MAEIDFSDYADFDPETIDQGGLPKPGKAHLLVASVEDKGEYLQVTEEIVAHEDQAQVGKNVYNILNKTGKGSRRSLIFALACGVVTRQELAEAKAAGTSIDIDFDACFSKSYLGTLVESTYNGRKKCRVEWDFKAVDDGEAGEYPRNPEYAPPLEDGAGATPSKDEVPF